MFMLLSEQATGNSHGPYGRLGLVPAGTMLVTPGLGLIRYQKV